MKNYLKKVRLEKLEKIIKKGINPYPSQAKKTHTCQEAILDFEELAKKETIITLAGRLRSIRLHGGSCFCHLEDGSGKIQIYLKKDLLTHDSQLMTYDFFKDLIDIGDFIEVTGTLFKTKKNEKTLLVKKFKLLSKSLLPLPEKWHGLQDVEIRYRKRYLDLISNPKIKEIFQTRSLIIETIRQFLLKRGYLEVETPILQPIYGGGFAQPFRTHHNALDIDLYLRISDELYLKRLLVGGLERVFEFCKDFRNEGISPIHNPEFTLLEIMTAYVDYKYSMDLVEEIYQEVILRLFKKIEIEYQGIKINFKRPWLRIKFVEAIKEFTGIDIFSFKDIDQAKKAALSLDIEKEKIKNLSSIGQVVAKIFEEKVEERLIQPTIVYDYPIEVCPLTKRCKDDPRLAERFEHFVVGKEHSNNYSELNEPLDLKKRFIEEKKKIKAGDAEAHQADEDFLQAIEYGLPPCSGIGIGIDRLVMLLTNSSNIKEVILFPILRPKK